MTSMFNLIFIVLMLCLTMSDIIDVEDFMSNQSTNE